jgi:hypothetical protein
MALKVTGKAFFSRSGTTKIGEGKSQKSVSLTGVTTASMVLATAQNASVYVKAVVTTTGSFTIRPARHPRGD